MMSRKREPHRWTLSEWTSLLAYLDHCLATGVHFMKTCESHMKQEHGQQLPMEVIMNKLRTISCRGNQGAARLHVLLKKGSKCPKLWKRFTQEEIDALNLARRKIERNYISPSCSENPDPMCDVNYNNSDDAIDDTATTHTAATLPEKQENENVIRRDVPFKQQEDENGFQTQTEPNIFNGTLENTVYERTADVPDCTHDEPSMVPGEGGEGDVEELSNSSDSTRLDQMFEDVNEIGEQVAANDIELYRAYAKIERLEKALEESEHKYARAALQRDSYRKELSSKTQSWNRTQLQAIEAPILSQLESIITKQQEELSEVRKHARMMRNPGHVPISLPPTEARNILDYIRKMVNTTFIADEDSMAQMPPPGTRLDTTTERLFSRWIKKPSQPNTATPLLASSIPRTASFSARSFLISYAHRKNVSPLSIVRILASAALCEWVFESELPNFYPNRGGILDARMRQEVTQQDGMLVLRNRDLLARHSMVHQPYFRTDWIRQQAQEFRFLLFDRIKSFYPNPEARPTARGHSHPVAAATAATAATATITIPTKNEKSIWESRQATCEKWFETALRLKADLVISIDLFELVVIPPGEAFNAASMRAETEDNISIRDPIAASGSASPIVKLCLFPALYSYPCEAVQGSADRADVERDIKRAIVQNIKFSRVAAAASQRPGAKLIVPAYVLLEE